MRRIRAQPMYCVTRMQIEDENSRIRLGDDDRSAVLHRTSPRHGFRRELSRRDRQRVASCPRRHRRSQRSDRCRHAAGFALAQLHRLSRQREKILRRRRRFARVDPERQSQPSSRLDDPPISAGRVERPQPRGLRRIAMGRASRQAPTDGVAEAYRRRSCTYRSGADCFRDALHFRSAYRKGQPAALQVRPDGRSQKV